MGRNRKRRYIEPFEVDIEKIGKKGVGVGLAPDGSPVWVKFGVPNARLLVHPTGRRKGHWDARPMKMLRKPEGWTKAPCPSFGVCGGCTLQELNLTQQRKFKEDYALEQVITEKNITLESLQENVRIYPIRGSQDAYKYRNKVEFSFGNKQFLSDEEFQEGLDIEGKFLGFHASGRFDRIVDRENCWLVADEVNELLSILRKYTLKEDAPPTWNPRTHQGFWRHAMFRHGQKTNEILLALYTFATTNPKEEQAIEELVSALQTHQLANNTKLVGVVWLENTSVADVAQGNVKKIWGQDWFEEQLGSVHYKLSYRSFFQTSTDGAVVLYDTISEALGNAKGTLYDLYCGVGSIGLYLSDKFDKIIGIEEIPEAVEDARLNAQLNNITDATYHVAKVENVLEELPHSGDSIAIVVDPPRAGLHHKVARTLANAQGDILIYVACNPASLGRDALFFEQGRWKMTKLWSVDLFPQTGHIEMVARFEPK